MDMYNVIGYVGAALYVLAYLLLTLGRWGGNGIAYTLTNLAGALLVIISLLEHHNAPSLLIQCVWVVISIVGLGRIAWQRQTRKPAQGQVS